MVVVVVLLLSVCFQKRTRTFKPLSDFVLLCARRRLGRRKGKNRPSVVEFEGVFGIFGRIEGFEGF